MTRIKLNPIIEQMQGAYGDVVFRRSHTGKTIISHKPDMSKVVWSEAQIAHRRRFKAAVAYARAAMAQPRARAVYELEAAAKGKRPFDLAVSDYFKGRDLLNGVTGKG